MSIIFSIIHIEFCSKNCELPRVPCRVPEFDQIFIRLEGFVSSRMLNQFLLSWHSMVWNTNLVRCKEEAQFRVGSESSLLHQGCSFIQMWTTLFRIFFKQPLKIEWNLKILIFLSPSSLICPSCICCSRAVSSSSSSESDSLSWNHFDVDPIFGWKNHEKTMGLTVKFSTDFLLDKISPWNFLIGSVMDAGLDFGLWSSIGKHTCVLSLAYQQLFHLRSPLWRIWSCVGGSWSRPIINSSKKLRSSASFRCDQVTDLTPQLVQYLIMYRIRKIQNSEYKQISCKYQANIKDNFK